MVRTRKTASVGIYNELMAQAHFAKDPNKIVFVPVMGKGPIDMVVLDIKDRRSIKPMMSNQSIKERKTTYPQINIREMQ
jgi:redox-regulated HSP33 family molecular chaperone